MNINGYQLLGDWKNTNVGQVANVECEGVMYIMTKFQTPVKPFKNGTLDPKTYENNLKIFEDFVVARRRVNYALRSVSDILFTPCDEFVDGFYYYEVRKFSKDILSAENSEYLVRTLPEEGKRLLMLTATGALVRAHNLGVVHGNLGLYNVLLMRNSAGNYIASISGWDFNFFADDKLAEIMGDIVYYSPEMGAYCDSVGEDNPDEVAALRERISEKTDIYSLGLVFYYWLAGKLPQAKSLNEKLQMRKDKGRIIYTWVILSEGCELEIGAEAGRYASLIQDMLNADPEKRPSAKQVIQRLKTSVNDERLGANHSEGCAQAVHDGKFAEPWPEHNIKELLRT